MFLKKYILQANSAGKKYAATAKARRFFLAKTKTREREVTKKYLLNQIRYKAIYYFRYANVALKRGYGF